MKTNDEHLGLLGCVTLCRGCYRSRVDKLATYRFEVQLGGLHVRWQGFKVKLGHVSTWYCDECVAAGRAPDLASWADEAVDYPGFERGPLRACKAPESDEA